MEFIIHGNPIAQARHRQTRKGIIYDPQAKEKRKIREFLKHKSYGEKRVIAMQKSEAFKADFTFYMPIPKTDPTWKKNLKKWDLISPNVKPDLDNLEKFYLDCANEIVFPDDRMIVICSKKKKYHSNP